MLLLKPLTSYRKIFLFLLVVVFLKVPTAAGQPPLSLSSLSVTPANPSIPSGIKIKFEALGIYSDHSSKDITKQVTWSSDNKSVATVDSNGLVTTVAAGTATITAASGGISQNTIVTVSKTKREQMAEEFAGANFGVGLAVTFGIPRINSAEIGKDNIVRVTSANSDIPSVMLETHYFFQTKYKFFGLLPSDMWGFGPFIGVQFGTDQVIQAFGGGLMIGFRRSKETKDSFNIGIGAVLDTNVQTLADGFNEGQKPPESETQVRYKTTTKWGGLFMFSYAF